MIAKWWQRRGGEWLTTGEKRWHPVYDRRDIGGALCERFEVEQGHTKTGERRWVSWSTGYPRMSRRLTWASGKRMYEPGGINEFGPMPFQAPWDESRPEPTA